MRITYGELITRFRDSLPIYSHKNIETYYALLCLLESYGSDYDDEWETSENLEDFHKFLRQIGTFNNAPDMVLWHLLHACWDIMTYCTSDTYDEWGFSEENN